jgi:hypothetical protein
VSTLAHWLAVRGFAGPWIMPDEAIYAERGIELWHHGSLPLLGGQGAGYGVLYPALAGVPLSWGGFVHGYAWLKALQALVVSLAAVPVFLAARRLMPPPYALLAAALTLCYPLLLYSGLVMTEVLFYPLAAAALLAAARAVETGARRDQLFAFALVAAAVLTRVQAVVLVPAFAGAAILDALLARRPRRLRAFWPLWVVLAGAAAVAAAAPGVFGSYAGTVRGSYPIGHALGLIFDHAAFVVLATGVVPAFALVLLLLRARDPGARALAATCASATVLVVVQVGFFAARYAPHVLGRDLAALPPLLFVAFALWLARGAPRPWVASALVAFGLLCLLLPAPWGRLVVPDALADTFDLAILYRLRGLGPGNVVLAAALVLVVLCFAARRRFTLVLPVAVGTLLVSSTVVAAVEIGGRTRADRAAIVGPVPDWIDRAADGPVTYVYAKEAYWNTVWQERLWNDRVTRVLALRPSRVPGPMPQTRVRVPPSGRLPIDGEYAVASDRLAFVGTPVAHLAQSGLDVSGLTLWRLDPPARLSTVVHDVLPNGDMTGPATVDVYDCVGGRLDLTLLPKETKTLSVSDDGIPLLRADVGGLAVWHGAVRVPRSRVARMCRLTIEGGTLLGSTRIAFVRG